MFLKCRVAPDRMKLEGDFGVETLCTDADIRNMFGLCAAVTFDSPVFGRTTHLLNSACVM
jgi:hypothetical protein